MHVIVRINQRSVPAVWETPGELGRLAGTRYTIGDLKGFMQAAGCPADKVDAMAAIGMAESSGYSAASNITSREHSIGLWQINLNAHTQYTDAQMSDPMQNARAAVAILNSEGLRAWGAYTDGRYLPYLTTSTSTPASTPSESPSTNTSAYDSPAGDNSSFSAWFKTLGTGGIVVAAVVAVLLLRD
jgi:Lysozyme like domain